MEKGDQNLAPPRFGQLGSVPEQTMNPLKRLVILVASIALLVGVTLAQGPKKDIGVKVPLPDAPADKSGPPQKDAPPRVESLSIDVDLVDIDVVVTDNSGNPIGGLTKSNFKIFDDNVEQKITNFSPSDAPLTIVLLLGFGRHLRLLQ